MNKSPENLELPLPSGFAPEQMKERLESLTGKRIELIVTRNRVSLIHFRQERDQVRLRLHEVLLDMPEEIVESLASWIRKPRRTGAPLEIRQYIRNIQFPEREQTHSPRTLRPQGAVHDLEQLAQKVNQEWFAGSVTAKVTWGKDTSSKRVRVRRLGSYQRSTNTIVIHPVLDDVRVPEMVVSFTLYHEMLHALQPASQKRHHDKVFREKEQAHPDYEVVERWMKKNVRLINGGHRRKLS